MELLKVFYSKEVGGFMLFTPDMAQLPYVQRVVVDDQWDDSKNNGRVLVTVTLQAQLVNEMPVPPFGPEIHLSGDDVLSVMKKAKCNHPGSAQTDPLP